MEEGDVIGERSKKGRRERKREKEYGRMKCCREEREGEDEGEKQV